MSNSRFDCPEEWLEPEAQGADLCIEKKVFLEMPEPKRKRLAKREAKKRDAIKILMTPSLVLARKRKTIAQQSRRRYHFDSFQKLPAELILEIMEKTKPRDLKNLVLATQRVERIAKLHEQSIHIGIQKEQFFEYYRLFGTDDLMTPDQEYHTAIEKENREWWNDEEDKRFYLEHGIRRHTNLKLASPGVVGRVTLYSALAKDIEDARIALTSESLPLSAGSIEVTEKALLLFWQMQWNDRPGLEHLCERTETENGYNNKRQKLFTTEGPQVRSCFLNILKPVVLRVWKRLEFWDYTRSWSSNNINVIRSQQQINTDDLDSWVREMVAELMIEVTLKIGVRRALRLNHADECDRDTEWIIERTVDKLEELLKDLLEDLLQGTVSVPKIPVPRAFLFGRAMGLQPEDIIDKTIPILSGLLTA